MSYLTCTEGGSDKFYQIFAIGNNVSMKYGKTGSDGVSSTKSFGSADEANKFVNKTVAEKLKKGYVESTAIGSKRPAPAAAESAVKKAKASPAPKAPVASKIPTSESTAKKTSYLTCQEGNSDKFYEIIIDGINVSMRYGRSGTSGVSSMKEFASAAEASKFMDKTINEKLKKGYVENGSADKSTTSATKQVPAKAATKQEKVVKPGKAAASAVTVPSTAGKTTYLTCQEGNSDKFYEISLSGTEVTMRYGKTGSDGVTNLKSFGSAAEAEKFVTKTINEKLKKGYEEGEGGGDGDEAAEMDEEDDESDEDDAGDESGRTYLTCTEGNSNKFYEVIQRGCEVATRYGKIGSEGTSSSKTMKSEAEAKKAADKIVADKVKGGYVVEKPAKGKKAQEKVKDDPSDTPYNKANIKALEWLFC